MCKLNKLNRIKFKKYKEMPFKSAFLKEAGEVEFTISVLREFWGAYYQNFMVMYLKLTN